MDNNRLNNPNGRIDPVCGMHVDPRTAAASAFHDGREVFFCAEKCKHAFEADPDRFLKKGPKRKGFWRRYLDRLNRATSGEPPVCCQ